MSTGLALAITAVLLLANAFFVGAEFALISVRRSSIEPRARAGSRLAAITLSAMEHVSLMLAGAQLGVTGCSLGLGYLVEPAIAGALRDAFEAIGLPEAVVHPIAFAIALGLLGFLHVVLGEMVPKNIALAGPDRTALTLVPPLALIVRVFHPVIALLNWIARALLRLAGIELRDEVTSAFTRDEVAGLVEESRREGMLDREEEQLLVGALRFEERTTATVLLPLARLSTVPPDVTPEDVERLAARTGYSRFPVARDGRLVGYVHLKDVLEIAEERRRRPIDPSSIRPLATVRDTDPLRVELATMQRSSAHLARVTDANGATLGVVALEDVLEELVGEVQDEMNAARR